MSLFFLVACTRPLPSPADGATDSPGPPTEDSGSEPTAATGSTADTAPPLPTFDCATIPLGPVGYRELPGARGYHDVVFDTVGHILGISVSEDLLAADHDGNVDVFLPNVGGIEQMAWLPDGDLAVASSSRGILRVASTGATTVINGDIRPYGLITGPDGMLYSANQDVVHRVDPDSGEAEVLVPRGTLTRGSPRVLNFSLDDTELYVGTYLGSQGRIYAFPLDDTFTPTGPPTVFASDVGTGSYHDAIGVDICGYLYVPDYDTSSLFRVSPSGQVQTLLESDGLLGAQYGHGLEWGNGVGGWLDDAIYLPQPYHGNTVGEVKIGVPSRDWPGVALNLP